MLGLGALGVVFGDIGTSPLYAFQSIFAGPHAIDVNEGRVLGAVSTVFWTLTLIVTIKYVMIVMRADNDGEGGVMSLTRLVTSLNFKSKKTLTFLTILGIGGACLFYGDGMITPAISVLSAVEGMEVVDPDLSPLVIPIAIAVLVLLFLAQRHGTGKIGKAFGPIMLLWFITIGIFGLASILKTPHVLVAINPTHALNFIQGEFTTAFFALGSVVLCVTGAEALYADMGQFGRRPIRLAWFVVATPALYLTYFGQAALVIRDHSAASNPFYLLVPNALQIPMIILATMATVIASQAVISGAFSMTRQAIHLGYLPQMRVKHTSNEERGQVYLPAVNWALMIGVIGLVLAFQTSSNLSAAYGIAVTGTFVVTSILITQLALKKWKYPKWVVLPFAALFLFIDVSFFASNMTKFFTGGWFPLLIAAILFCVLTTWRAGALLMRSRMEEQSEPLKVFAENLASTDVTRVAGESVYLTSSPGFTPFAMELHLRVLHALPHGSTVLGITVADRPRVPDDERVTVINQPAGIQEVEARIGFMERPNIGKILDLARPLGVEVNQAECRFVMHSATVEPSKNSEMWLPRQRLFAVMQRMVVDPMVSLPFPNTHVYEIGTVVRL